MSAAILNRVVCADESKIPELEKSPWLKFLIDGVNAKDINAEKKCDRCGSPVTWLVTKSEVYGEIACIPAECSACRKLTVDEHTEQERRQNFMLVVGKCGGYQNREAFFRGRAVTWEDISKDYLYQREFLRYLPDAVDGKENRGAFVFGPTGTGKTFLSKLLHNELLAAFKHSCFIKAVDLAILIRRIGMDRTAGHILDELRHVHTLIVDDYGTQKNTEWVKEAIYSIFDYRYDNKKRTVLTTNMRIVDILNEDSRLGSRFSDPAWMLKIELSGHDMREALPQEFEL